MVDTTNMSSNGNHEPSELLLHYRVTRSLGGGPHGESFLAIDTGLERPVTIKKLTRPVVSGNRRQEYLAAMEKLAAIPDPTLTRFYSLEEVAGQQLLIREYVEGKSIRELASEEPLSVMRTCTLLIPIVRVLQACHEQNVAHLNLTLSNIIADIDGTARLTDFGLTADLFDCNLTDRPAVVSIGLAPEQLCGAGDTVDFRADYYALGVVICEMLTGQQPFLSSDPETQDKASKGGQVPLDDSVILQLPPEMQLLVSQLLVPDPQRRFTSASGLVASLEEMLSFRLRTGGVATVSKKPRASPRQYLMVSILVVLFVILWLVLTAIEK